MGTLCRSSPQTPWLKSGFLFWQDSLVLSDECCVEKTVGGVRYVQVPGNTEGYPCDGECVYEEVGKPGSHTCFRAEADGLSVSCTESTVDSMFITISRKNGENAGNDEIVFKAWNETFHCNLEPPTSGTDQDIECSLKNEANFSDFTPDVKQSSLFLSTSFEGTPEWLSLHTENKEFIHGTISNVSVCQAPCFQFQYTLCFCFVSSSCAPANKSLPWLVNKLYVEQGVMLSGTLNVTQAQEQCRNMCHEDQNCTFWTLSFHDDTDHEHARNHRGSTECGIRYYQPKFIIPTNKNQYTAKRDANATQVQKGTYVWKFFKQNMTDNACCNLCKQEQECTTWTYDISNNQGVCALNSYTPTRLIDISYVMPKPSLVSGCDSTRTTCPFILDNPVGLV